MDRRGSWRYSTPVLPVLERGTIGTGTGGTGGTGGALLGRSSLMMAQMSIREHASDSDSDTENEKDPPRERRSTHFSSNPFQVHQERVVVVMVGLPARGKSYISHAIIRYLEFLGCPSKLFNVGDQRRKRGLGSGTSAHFFDAANTHAKRQREQLAMDCLEDLLQWLHETTTTNTTTNTDTNINPNQHSEMNGASGHSRRSSSSSSSSRRSSGHGRARGCAVGILDATNTTIARRHKVMERIAAEVKHKDPHVVLLFVESITNDPQLLEWNYKMKLSNKDYTGMDPTVALQDFRKRVTKYEQVYESITDQEGRPTRSDNRGTSTSTSIRYMKLIDAGRELITHGMTGGLTMTQIQRLLGTIHLGPRTIYLVLVGETRNDTQHIVGGDSYLSRQGRQYAQGVAQLLQTKVVAASIPDDDEQQSSNNKATTTTTKMVYIGTLKRYNAMAKLLVETTDSVPYTVLSLGAVNDLSCGDLEGLTEDQRDNVYPYEKPQREDDPLNYRYPGVGGESFWDLITRSNDTVLTLEQSRGDSVVISDRAVLQCLYGYFVGKSLEEIPDIDIPNNTVIEMRRSNSGFNVQFYPIAQGKSTSRSGL